MAANIDEAIENIDDVIGTTAGVDTLPRMADWIEQMFTDPSQFPPPGIPWDRGNLDQRSVYDWVVKHILADEEMNGIGESQEAANIAIDVVLRALLAVKFGNIEGRVTQNQEDSTVIIYTNVWE